MPAKPDPEYTHYLEGALAEGKSVAQMAVETGRIPHNIHAALRLRGLPTPNQLRRAKLQALSEESVGLSEMAETLGESKSTVKNVARHNGFTARDNGPAPEYEMAPHMPAAPISVEIPPPPTSPFKRKAKALRMRQAGHPPAVIAMYCGVTRAEAILFISGASDGLTTSTR